jgi:hypothetical protein
MPANQIHCRAEKQDERKCENAAFGGALWLTFRLMAE